MHPAFAELRQKQAPPSTPRSHPRGRGIADLAELGTGGAAHEPNVWSGGGPVNQPQLYDAALYAEPAAQQSSSIAAQPIAPPGAEAEPWAGQVSHDVRGAAAHPFDTSGETWDRTLTCGRRTVGSARPLAPKPSAMGRSGSRCSIHRRFAARAAETSPPLTPAASRVRQVVEIAGGALRLQKSSATIRRRDRAPRPLDIAAVAAHATQGGRRRRSASRGRGLCAHVGSHSVRGLAGAAARAPCRAVAGRGRRRHPDGWSALQRRGQCAPARCRRAHVKVARHHVVAHGS